MTDSEQVAYKIVKKYIEFGVKFIVGSNVYAEWMKKDIVEALSNTTRQEREKVAALMLRNSISTGHGDSIDDLLNELESTIIELQKYKMAIKEKEKAMEILFDRLHKAGIDYSDLIP